jgi:hypothetical protein
VFTEGSHQAAAVLTYLSPGLRFFHQGQLEGRRVHLPVQLCRGPDEAPDPELSSFYRRLLQALKNNTVREGDWRLLEPQPAWTGNWTSDSIIVFTWSGGSRQSPPVSPRDQPRDLAQLLVAVNYASHDSQCNVSLPVPGLEGGIVHLQDCLSETRLEIPGADLSGRGLYLDLAPWGYHVFELTLTN